MKRGHLWQGHLFLPVCGTISDKKAYTDATALYNSGITHVGKFQSQIINRIEKCCNITFIGLWQQGGWISSIETFIQ